MFKEELLELSIEKLKNYSIVTEDDVIRAVQSICDENSEDYPINDNWWAELFQQLDFYKIKLGVRTELKENKSLQESVFANKLKIFLSRLWKQPAEQALIKQIYKFKDKVKGEEGKQYIKDLISSNKTTLSSECSQGFSDELNKLANEYLAEAKDLNKLFKKNTIKRLERLLVLQIERKWDVQKLSLMLSKLQEKRDGVFSPVITKDIERAKEAPKVNIQRAIIKLIIENLKEELTLIECKLLFSKKYLLEKTAKGFELDFRKALKGDYSNFISELGQWASDPKVSEFIKAGLKDGNSEDDRFTVEQVSIPVSKLIPTQNEIDFNKSLFHLVTNPGNVQVALQGKNIALGTVPLVVFNGKYIIDGHHRWSQIYCGNPNATMKCLNFKKEASPLDVLKSMQIAVVGVTGKLIIGKVDGKNLLNSRKNEVTGYIIQNLNEKTATVFRQLKKFKKPEEVAEYIWGNCEQMQKSNQPIPNAPERSVMPQTGDHLPQITKSLTKGFANTFAPFVKENTNNKKMKRSLKENRSSIQNVIDGWDDDEVKDAYRSLLGNSPDGMIDFEDDLDIDGQDMNDMFDPSDDEKRSYLVNYFIDDASSAEKVQWLGGLEEKVEPIKKPKPKTNPNSTPPEMGASDDVRHMTRSKDNLLLDEDGPTSAYDEGREFYGSKEDKDDMYHDDSEDLNPYDYNSDEYEDWKLGYSEARSEFEDGEFGLNESVEAKNNKEYYLVNADGETVKTYNSFDKEAIKKDIIAVLTEDSDELITLEAQGKDFNDTLGIYEVNPKSGRPSLVITKGNKTVYKPLKEARLSESLDNELNKWLSGGNNSPKEITNKIKTETGSDDFISSTTGSKESAQHGKVETEGEMEFNNPEVWKEFVKNNFKGTIKFEEEPQAFDDEVVIYATCGDRVVGEFQNGFGKLNFSTYDELEKSELEHKLEDTVFKGTKTLKEREERIYTVDNNTKTYSLPRKMFLAAFPNLAARYRVENPDTGEFNAEAWQKVKPFNVWRIVDEFDEDGVAKVKVQNMKSANWFYKFKKKWLLPVGHTLTEDTTTADIAVFDTPIIDKNYKANLVRRKNSFINFVQENCNTKGYNKKGKFDINSYLKSRPTWFKQKLIKEFNETESKRYAPKAMDYNPAFFDNKSYAAVESAKKIASDNINITDFFGGVVSVTPYSNGRKVGRTQTIDCGNSEQLKKVLLTYKSQYAIADTVVATDTDEKEVGIIKEAFDSFQDDWGQQPGDTFYEAKKGGRFKRAAKMLNQFNSDNVSAETYEKAFNKIEKIYDKELCEKLDSFVNSEEEVDETDLINLGITIQNRYGTEIEMVVNAIEDLNSYLGVYYDDEDEDEDYDENEPEDGYDDDDWDSLKEAEAVNEVEFTIDAVEVLGETVVFQYNYNGEEKELDANLSTFSDFLQGIDSEFENYSSVDKTGNEDYPKGFGKIHNFEEYWNDLPEDLQNDYATKFLVNKMGLSPKL